MRTDDDFADAPEPRNTSCNTSDIPAAGPMSRNRRPSGATVGFVIRDAILLHLYTLENQTKGDANRHTIRLGGD